jgi:hypothetical protein
MTPSPGAGQEIDNKQQLTLPTADRKLFYYSNKEFTLQPQTGIDTKQELTLPTVWGLIY